jgi:hemerythrin-like domain-containing protein
VPIVIGARRESDFTDPIGMLSDCHRRIERFLQTLIAVGRDAHGGLLDSGKKAALETSLKYFREAAPKHTADEEESLFPRLRGIDSAEAREVLARVAALESDHERAEASHQEVERLGQEWLARGQLPAGEASRFDQLLADLANLYHHHIRIEDTEVFPSARRLLSSDEKAAVGAEMAARRGVRARDAG